MHEGIFLVYQTGNCHEQSTGGLFSGGSSYEECKVTFVVSEENEYYEDYATKEVSIDGEMAKRIVETEPRYGDQFFGVVRWRSYKGKLDYPKVLDVTEKEVEK